jgi:dihydrofolate synthase/folylpolyglutamate synthase
VRLLEAAQSQGVAIAAAAIADGLARPHWPARLELFELEGGGRVLLDAAHNVDGAVALATYLREWYPARPLLVLGVMHDKDVDAMLRALLPAVAGVITTAAPTPRAMTPDELARHARLAATALRESGLPAPGDITVEPDPDAAVRAALRRSEVVCVAGSIFLAGAVRSALKQRAILR